MMDAVKTTLLEGIVMVVIFAAAGWTRQVTPELAVLVLCLVFLSGPLAVLFVYRREFSLSIFAYFISLLLTALSGVVLFSLLTTA